MADDLKKWGYGEVWVFQTEEGSAAGAQEHTMEAIKFLGQWFKAQTGKMLVITAITNGKHAAGDHSHANGWKFDCNDWGGPEGLDGKLFGTDHNQLDTDLAAAFAKYGADKGLGMNLECPNTDNVHWDVSAWGEQWTGPFKTGNMGGWKGCGLNPPTSTSKKISETAQANNAANNAAGGSNRSPSVLVANPANNTKCEPIYPDLQFVPGNIPNSLIEQVLSTAKSGTQNVGGKNNPYQLSASLDALTGLKLGQFVSDTFQVNRQKTFDVLKNINDQKAGSGGKPLNNNDRYPVDLKAEELQVHQPRVKQPCIKGTTTFTGNDAAIGNVLLNVADHAEKRLVKLENVLATVMKYVWGIAGRMHVNCVYYGGQDHRAKYKCIRCMRDDRVHDGQVMQLDQCLSCSRYEPVFGYILFL